MKVGKRCHREAVMQPQPTCAASPWTLRQAAVHLKVSVDTLRRLMRAGKLKVIRIGSANGRVMVPDAEVNRIATFGAL